jgi:uncharacterized protein YdhG (YjbR/CyaY superfamily)
MNRKPATIDGYLARIPRDQRLLLTRLRRMIRRILPRAEECISYGMPAFRFGGQVVAGFAARRDGGGSYYPFSGSTLDALARELGAFSRTKSALHFSADRPLPATMVRKLLRARIAEISAPRRSRRSPTPPRLRSLR